MDSPLTVTATEGSLDVTILGSAELRYDDIGYLDGSGGVVTSVLPTSIVDEGQVLMTVNLRPVVVLRGEIPMFRDFVSGLDGPDVEQLQNALKRLGYDVGEVDGSFGPSTRRAWSAFLEDRGFEAVRSIPKAEVVFLPVVPVRAADVAVEVGDVATGRLMGFTGVEPELVALVPLGAPDDISVGDRVELVVGSSERLESSITAVDEVSDEIIARLRLPDDTIPDDAALRARIFTSLGGSGVVVPTTALYTSADGSIYVRLWHVDGSITAESVEIIETTRDQAIVSGSVVSGDELVVRP
ncbi:MAG: peptidoglycan-binding domain-containing protein [Acidimicrobiia bacterium]|nr:peptidoglycan-binding domain-containing protein [Acidimicrobiia bacterium]